jgi:twitching motility protein PilT
MPFIDIGNLFGNKKNDDAAESAAVADGATVTTTTTTTATDPNATPAATAATQTLEEYLAAQPDVQSVSTSTSQVVAPMPVENTQPQADLVNTTETSTTTTVTSTPVVEPKNIEFSSTPDVEDPDKPAQVEAPAVVITPGTELKQNGIREVKGPEFISPEQATNPVAQLAELDMDAKIAEMNKIPDQQTTLPDPAQVVEPPSMPATTLTEPMADTVDGDILSQLSQTEPPATEPVETAAAGETVAVPEADNELGLGEIVSLAEPTPAEPLVEATESVDASPLNTPEVPDVADVAEALVTPEVQVEVAPSAPDTASEMPMISELNEIGNANLSLDELLGQAVSRKASDLHLSPGYRPMVRISGKLETLVGQLLDDAKITEMIKLLVPDIDLETTKDVDMAYQTADKYRFRVNIFKQRHGFGIVARVISSSIPALDSLNLPIKVKDFTEISQGLILVTGPTGSGKSTTIAALLQDINSTKNKHIVTIEDPVEYIYPAGQSLIDQRNIGEDTDNWAKALRAVLRQDPDIVLVGEMRDFETIAAALTVAETGHLVFATLHTNSAAQSIDRIVDVFPEDQQQQVRTQLANVLVGVVSQRLIPINGGGRRAAVEIMLANSAVRTAIREGKVHLIDNIIQTSAEVGMVAMEKSLVDLVRAGLISIEAAQYFSNKPDEVIRLLGGAAPK